ncbi:hypothetical protein [Dactylosporangium sp. NPDC000521]|uniref:glycine-rich domain-containing protein n=1 Tax=Dactylosporangium sp. NPDC000521 TaxID=3363975 RepID=UPI0036D1D643
MNSSAVCFGGAGGAGGSGAYVRGVVTASPTDGTLTVVVGAGGAGGAGAASASYTGGVSGSAGRPGTGGGDTTISNAGSTVINARGGAGGANGGGGNISGAAGSNGQGGSGGTGTFPADSGLSRAGGNGGNAAATSGGPQAGQPGSSTSNGMLPPAPNTGGAGGGCTQNQNPAGSGGAGRSGYAVLTVLSSPTTAPSEQITPAPWNQSTYNPTIDSPNSRATVTCTPDAVNVQIVVNRTNQPDKTLQFYYKIDDSAPIFTNVTVKADANGNATGSFSVPNVTRGDHRLNVLINTAESGQTFTPSVEPFPSPSDQPGGGRRPQRSTSHHH